MSDGAISQEEIDAFLFNQSDALKKDSTKQAINEFMNDFRGKPC